MAYQQEHRTGTSNSWWDGLFMPSFPIPWNNLPLPNVCASRSMTFKSRRRWNWDSRQSSSVHISSVVNQAAQSQWSQSSQPAPVRLGYANCIARAAGLPQVKSEPWSHTPATPLILSEKKKVELVGKCYLWKKLGHMARNCPQDNKVRFNTGKPPGTSNFNVEFDDSVKVLESLPLRMVKVERWEAMNNWCNHYLEWDQPGAPTQTELGNCYLMIAEYILTILQPYPRDERFRLIKPVYEHFNISRHTSGTYLIIDWLTGFKVKLAKLCLANPHFDLRRWCYDFNTKEYQQSSNSSSSIKF
jgi:hypothetical protein